MKNIAIFTLLLLMLFTSCKKITKGDDSALTNKDLPSVLNYFTALTTPVDMQIFLSSTTSMLSSGSNTTSQLLNGAALNSSQETVNIGSLIVNNTIIDPVNNNYNRSFSTPNIFYGQSLIIKTTAVSSPLITGYQFNDTVYSPNEIKINRSSINQELALNKIYPNKNIQWVADPNNTTGGVIIVAEYLPDDFLNANFRQSNPTYVRNGYVVPDNGSANIDNTLFTGMPIGSYLTVTLVRASYKKGVTDGLKSYLICSYSKTFMDFKYQP